MSNSEDIFDYMTLSKLQHDLTVKANIITSDEAALLENTLKLLRKTLMHNNQLQQTVETLEQLQIYKRDIIEKYIDILQKYQLYDVFQNNMDETQEQLDMMRHIFDESN